MSGWVQGVIGAAAFVTAVTVLVKSPPLRWVMRRLVVEPATDAIEDVMEPHLDALRSQLGDLNAKVDAVLCEVKPNGGRSLKDRVEQVHQAVVAEPEIERLRQEGRLDT